MKCPNCKKEIGRFELSPNCKHCGVNIFYAQQEGLLAEDAKRCELEYATFHILVAKLKTAFIGGKIQILRIIVMLIAIGAIFVPFATIEAHFSMFASEFSFGAWGIYQAFTDGTLRAILSLHSYKPQLTISVCLLLALIVLVFICGLGLFLTLLFSFINIQKTAKIAQGFSFTGMIISLTSVIEVILLPNILSDCIFIESKFGFGGIACSVVLLLMFILNKLIVCKNILPEIKEVDIQRVQIRQKIKNGELSYSDLPLPVLESPEEKEERLRSDSEKEKLVQTAKKGGQK